MPVEPKPSHGIHPSGPAPRAGHPKTQLNWNLASALPGNLGEGSVGSTQGCADSGLWDMLAWHSPTLLRGLYFILLPHISDESLN